MPEAHFDSPSVALPRLIETISFKVIVVYQSFLPVFSNTSSCGRAIGNSLSTSFAKLLRAGCAQVAITFPSLIHSYPRF